MTFDVWVTCFVTSLHDSLQLVAFRIRNQGGQSLEIGGQSLEIGGQSLEIGDSPWKKTRAVR